MAWIGARFAWWCRIQATMSALRSDPRFAFAGPVRTRDR